MKKQSLLEGTLILIFANTVSKILGAILKIPLTYILGEEGMAIYQSAFSIYIMLLSVVISGLPFALSKYISEEYAKNHIGNIRYAIRSSMIILSVLGAALSIFMYTFSDFFALSMKDPKAPFTTRMIAPSIFFVAIGAVYKSCYQARGFQTPVAVSQVLEALLKLLAGYFLASYFSVFSVAYTSGAAIFGVTIGEIFATLVLFVFFIPYRHELTAKTPETRKTDILKALAAISIPMTLTSMVSGSLSLLETSVVRNRLTDIIFTESSAKNFLTAYSPYTDIFSGLSDGKFLSFDGARWLYGAYSGYAATVFNLPLGILASFGVAILPTIASSVALGNSHRLKSAISETSKIIFAISLPLGVAIFTFSEQILLILFKNTASAQMLKALSVAIPIVALDQFICTVLYSGGEILKPFRYSLLANGVKISLSYILIKIPEINIFGAIIAGFFAVLLQLILASRLVKKSFGVYPLSFPIIAKIILCASIFTVLLKLLHRPFSIIFNLPLLTIISATLTAFIGYILSIFLFDVIKKLP